MIILNTKRGGHCSWYEGFFPLAIVGVIELLSALSALLLKVIRIQIFFVDVIRKSLEVNQI